jgi:hypothetical protein
MGHILANVVVGVIAVLLQLATTDVTISWIILGIQVIVQVGIIIHMVATDKR